jgi:hypothetical protein
VKKGIENIDQLYPEQRAPLEKGGKLLNFKKWFEELFETSDFDYVKGTLKKPHLKNSQNI